jgi:hypothetical protein
VNWILYIIVFQVLGFANNLLATLKDPTITINPLASTGIMVALSTLAAIVDHLNLKPGIKAAVETLIQSGIGVDVALQTGSGLLSAVQDVIAAAQGVFAAMKLGQ